MEIGKSKMDTALINEGVWTDFVLVSTSREPVTIRLKMALADVSMNARYKEALRKGLQPYERLMAVYRKGTDMPAKMSAEINQIARRVFVETVVVDWEGPTKNGGPLKYSPEACLALFEEYPELLAQAEAEASKFERYRVQVLEDAAGN